MPKPKVVEINIKAQLEQIEVPIISVTELIMHRWSDKAKKMMLDKQMGIPVPKREKKDPKEDYMQSIYRDAEGHYAMPSGAFKAAIVGGCRCAENLKMTVIKQCIRVEGEFTRIYGEPYMREDMVRLESGVADIRFRAGFKAWKAKLKITYLANTITESQLFDLVNLAGFGGVGEWRPSAPHVASGNYGCFRVADFDEWNKLKL